MNSLFTQHNESKGFSLVETLVAILIFSASITAFLTVVSRGVVIGTSAKNTAIANFLAVEGVEVVRNQRDSNSLQKDPFLQGFYPECGGTYGCEIVYPDYSPSLRAELSECLVECGKLYLRASNRPYYTTVVTSYPTPFTRTIFVSETVPDKEYKVTSTVSWEEKGVPRSVEVVHDLYAWYQDEDPF